MGLCGKIVSVLVLYQLYVCCFAQKETVLRTNWGVHFDEIGSIISQHQLSYYTHSFAIPWPKLNYKTTDQVNCSMHLGWGFLCKTLNRIIQDVNTNNYELFSHAAHEMQQAIDLIPTRNLTSHVSYNKTSKYRRMKRSFWNSIKHTFSKIGNAFTDLFHMPGQKDIDTIEKHQREVNDALRLNSDAVRLFENTLTSTQVLFDTRIQNLHNGLRDTEEEISAMSSHISDTYADFNDSFVKLSNETNQLSTIISFVVSRFLPSVFRQQLIMQQLLDASLEWYQGIVTLYDGKLSQGIIPGKFVGDIIRTISTKVLTQTRYAHLKLLSSRTDFYYKQKNIVVTVENNTLIVLIKFPLKQIGGVLKVYRAYSFPVPFTAGMNTGEGEKPYTQIVNIPDYIAVTDNGEYYLTLSSAIYQTCEGDGIKICRRGMPSLQHAGTLNCLSALYFDNSDGIQKACDIIMINEPPPGKAVQLVGDNSFLIHGASGGDDLWRMRCVMDSKSTQQVIKPCSMCRVQIPCFCTFGANEFEINARVTECINKVNEQGYPKVTYLNHLNLALMTSLFPKNILSEIHSYEAKIDDLYPTLNMSVQPILKSNWSDIAREDVSAQQDFKKISRNTYQHIISYEAKEDKLDKKVKDFSDVPIRTSNLLKGVRDIFNVFGSFGGFLKMFFTQAGISVIAFIYTTCFCLPMLCSDINLLYQTARRRLTGSESESHKTYYKNIRYSSLKNKVQEKENETSQYKSQDKENETSQYFPIY